MKRLVLFFLCGCWVCFSGCEDKLPADFPKVYPITVKVTDGTTPLPEVRIMFYQLSSGTAYAASGSTKANGVARISTSQGAFTKPGIPAGEFVVTVEDIIEVDMGVSVDELMNMSVGELQKLDAKRNKIIAEFDRKVPLTLRKTGKLADRSPIRFTATEGKNELLINVADYK